ncbi:MAG: arginine repressor [Inconstantimicrobium porci]|uniref:Arginine repressor n=1 Tax=Inconstantimicrobium porci TaxID=2652291 RepID=A0A7X2MVV3_9CLOT|nr:arginine repressor [Inconstantimicrobium porci]MDD6771875.1 arginine repressor [Inconstantimicrobium porci]MDY5913424.1 arginine repressor [Inconstantimicrobium porci]MSR90051.1 arginine repressor [Inconstantimicrobium porci]
MREKRQDAILEIIKEKSIETQEELVQNLKDRGFDVTQATISRDIKNLKLTKVLDDKGKYKYAVISNQGNKVENKMNQILFNTLLDVERVDKFVVVKTLSGSGSAAGEAIDTLNFTNVAGTIAGDNTIFILSRTDEDAQKIVDSLKVFLS